MAERLASLIDVKNVIKGDIPAGGEIEVAIALYLDSVSARMIEVIKSKLSGSLIAADYIENYGNEHYGHHARNTIRLRNRPVNSVASVVDTGDAFNPNDYYVDLDAGIITLFSTLRFTDSPGAVVVTYNAGYSQVGADDAQRVVVPDSLRMACIKQVKYEFQPRESGIPEGAAVITRPDGSVSYIPQEWLPDVAATLHRFGGKKFVLG